MTNAIVTTLEQGAIPTAIAVLQALKQFKTDLGTNPDQIPLTVGPALVKFTATVELQAPALASSEWNAAGSAFDSKVDGWISSLQAALSPASSGASTGGPTTGVTTGTTT